MVRVGVSSADLCPVSALVGYLRVRRSGGPLFLFHDGRYLTRRHVSVVLRGALGTEAGVNTHTRFVSVERPRWPQRMSLPTKSKLLAVGGRRRF